MSLVFKVPLPEEADTLSEIAILAKGHWGYPQEMLDLWVNDLRIEPSYIAAHTLRTFWTGQLIIGFFAIVEDDPPTLDHLWILPQHIGQGFGNEAIAEAKRLARTSGIIELIIKSDPHAEGFYLHQDAIRIGELPSVPQGRNLPLLRMKTG